MEDILLMIALVVRDLAYVLSSSMNMSQPEAIYYPPMPVQLQRMTPCKQ